MTQRTRDKINQANAQHSTGPLTPEGKQRSAMNAFKHGLTGLNLMVQADEQEAYDRLSRNIHADHNPQTETERQLVQQIIHCMLKLNRAAALENNMFSFATIEHATDAPHDDATETMAAQNRAWLANEKSFEQFGRHTTRISKDLFRFQHELERLQDHRKADAILENLRHAQAAAAASQAAPIKRVNPEMASFCKMAETVSPLHHAAPVNHAPFAEAATLPPSDFASAPLPAPPTAPDCAVAL